MKYMILALLVAGVSCGLAIGAWCHLYAYSPEIFWILLLYMGARVSIVVAMWLANK